MHDTKHVLSTQEQHRCAMGSQSPQLPQAHVNHTNYGGGSGMSSTAADPVNYLCANPAERAPAWRTSAPGAPPPPLA